MEEMIGYCGYNCHLCAARSPDRAVRQRLVDGWRRIFGHEQYTADNVHCSGCKGTGPHADQGCQARPCAEERGLRSCALCGEFPCKKVSPLLASREGMLVFCARGKDVTREEYELCMRQFESFPNIVAALAEAGKLPAWTARADAGTA
jgi:hypothetical protein